MIDRNAAEKAFMDYAGDFDRDDPMIRTKIIHTMNVTENADRIAGSIGLDGYERDLAWLLGLLHDFGRFVEKDAASDECMDYIRRHRCIPRRLVGSVFEGYLSHLCLAFELVYDETRRLVMEQGYLETLLYKTGEDDERVWNEAELAQLKETRDEVRRALGGLER